MTLKEWWNFNKDLILEDIFIVRVYNDVDGETTEKLLDSRIYIENAIYIFGSYIIKKIGIDSNKICISLCKPNVNDESL